VTSRALVCAIAAACSGEPSKLDELSGAADRAFTFQEIKPGIYHAVGTGKLVVVSNAAVIVGDRDVLVVDTHASPAAASALRDELKAITDKPIKFVVNTHHHFDHVQGNQIYGSGVEIIGHDQTYRAIVEGLNTQSRGYRRFVAGLPKDIADEEKQLATASAADRPKLEAKLAKDRQFLEQLQAVRPTPPTITLTQQMTLHRDAREIRIMFLGRGHTDGDVIVYLPKERVVATGDLLVEGTAYLGDGYFAEWIDTLDQLRKLDFDTVLPGHGHAFHGKDKLDHFQAYLRDFWEQAQAFHAQKLPWEEAAKRIDLRNHAAHYPTITEVGIKPDHGMARAYELLDGTVN
jgi:glyoxylase-like metal-dependent hydrolase (beta-lactamase superfamily II)